jgi:subtilase family serine protease
MKTHYITLTLGGLLAQIAMAPLALAYQPKIQPLSCQQPKAGWTSCFAEIVTDQGETPLVSGDPTGYSPAQLHTAYAMPSQATQPVTVAVVGAYHDAAITKDLHAYDAAFGIPDPPSLTQISQRGDHSYPAVDTGWALELSMDVEMAHQTCQNCPLLLVEADSPDITNLMAAVDMAARRGATVISNSYGGAEATRDTQMDAHLNHPGVTIVASAGDSGYGVSYPASSPTVIAVGGTTLTLRTSGTRLREEVWDGSGSGCSRYEHKPSWQKDRGCLNRTVTDIAADADPTTGAAVYDSLGYQGQRGWFVLGGTSLSAPLVAGMFALAGGGDASGFYRRPSALYDVTTGRNGSCKSYLCQGGSGYDGPSGLGAPNGLASFGR